jgi:glutamine amidotransferase
MIAIIDYDTGNLRSVENALGRLGAEYVVTADHSVIRCAERVVLPGVGEASSAMAKLRARGLDTLIPTLTQPVLGICIGLQLMCRTSEENDTRCMGIFNADVRRFVPSTTLKVPHMGWNRIENLKDPLFDGIEQGSYVYYVHSYAPEIDPTTIATTDYGGVFSAALGCDNFWGTQFHPEKSGAVGAQILKNFLEL